MARLRLVRASEELEGLSLVSSMIRLWEKIKAVRKKQGFISTKTDLKFKKQAMDAKSDLVCSSRSRGAASPRGDRHAQLAALA